MEITMDGFMSTSNGLGEKIMHFDVFISYAREDEAVAEAYHAALSAAGLEVFFAPVQLRQHEPNIHEILLAALAASTSVLVLWSKFVDKSEWVALELSMYATKRALDGERKRGLAALDLGGPLLPAWLPYDLFVPTDRAGSLAGIFKTTEWWTDHQLQAAVHSKSATWIRSALSISYSVLFDLDAWTKRRRTAVPRLGPHFSLSHLRSTELNSWPVARLLRDSFLALSVPIVVLTALCLGLKTWILPYPIDWQGYVPKEVLFTASASLAAGIIFSIRLGIAAAVAGGLVSAVAGFLVAMITGFFGRPDPWTGGAAAGAALGSVAAISLRLDAGARNPNSTTVVNWLAWAGCAVTFGIVAATEILTSKWTDAHPNLSPLSRMAVGLVAGATIFAPVGVIAGWFAHFQVRFRHWPKAAGFGLAVWLALAAATAIAASSIQFGNPFQLMDGVAVGLLSGAAAAGLATVVLEAVEPIAGEAMGTTTAIVLLFVIALPVLRLFPHIQADAVYAALLGGGILSFFTVHQLHRVRS
jgi:hypothetical protein